MKSMLILTDFSETAFRAAEYACGLVETLQIKRIVLYHAYQSTTLAATDLTVPVPIDNRQLYLDSMEALGLLHDRLKPLIENTIKMDLLAEDRSLPDLINERCREEDIGIIVMGVCGKSGLDELFIGNTTNQILKASEFPVLVVPPETLIGRKLETIIFTTDLKDFSAIPIRQLYEFLEAFQAKIHVVNVETEKDGDYSPEKKESISDLHTLLEKYHPVFHYINGEEIAESISAYSRQQHASLIITVPKKHNFFSALVHKSITKKLAHDLPVPLLSIPATPVS